MASRRCRHRTSPSLGALEYDDLLGEILLRLPPKPSSLPRASLVCKRWRSIGTNAPFRRHFRTHHRKPPILGVFKEHARELKFMPLLDPPDRIPSERFTLDLSADGFFSWTLLGCRHGRVLLLNRRESKLLVFEPVSGDTHRISVPLVFTQDGFTDASAAVLCAAGDDRDHVHGDCHTSPFKVVMVGTGSHAEIAIAQVYYRENGMWGDLIVSAEPCAGYVGNRHCTLVGNALYWCLYAGYRMRDSADDGILKFDLDSQSLTVISKPSTIPVVSQIQIIRAGDGGLGLAILPYPSFQLWDCMVDCHGAASWMLRKTVNMFMMLGWKADYTYIAGYAEDADAIFMSMHKPSDSDPFNRYLIIVQLESMKVEKHRGTCYQNAAYHPFTNFYTAGTARA